MWAGQGATNASFSNIIGSGAGQGATNADTSNFIGLSAGQSATNANNSNFIGKLAGFRATGASHSVLIGFNAGYATSTANSVGSNNIIIGTNVTLSAGTTNSLNIGNVLYGINTHSTTTGNPSITPQSTGRIGIGVVRPTANLHIAASNFAQALMRLTVGPAPSAPNDGDVWLESNDLTGLKIRISGVTRTINIT
jgi:hypothetical protein